MRVTILGNNSALPAFGRHPSAQTVTIFGEVLLIDCGEGTQIQMQRHGIKWRRLRHIFISHLHGDHYFGLPGLINSMSLMGRTLPLHLHAPAALKPILDAILDVADTVLSFPLIFEPLPDGSEVIAEGYTFKVTCFPVLHRIQCHGFLIETRSRPRRLLPKQCEQFGVPVSFYELLKDGADYEAADGSIVKNDLVTEPAPPSKKYAYCADTIYTESFLPMIENADAIYHEATYLEEDAAKATARYHCTASQAALIAKKDNVKLLLMGHFSSKYKDLEPFMTEATAVFENTQITVEGTAYEI